MMNKMMKTACALAVLAASANVMAESIELKVIGTITPPACKPMLAGSGTVDFGTIAPASLSKDNYTVLADKETTLNIVCDAPAKVAIKAVSGRKNTTLSDGAEGTNGAAKPLVSLGQSADFGVAGLGMDGDKKIGAYGVVVSDVVVDGVNGRPIKSEDKQTWSDSNANGLYQASGNDNFITWSNGTDVAPLSFENMNAKLTVKTYLNKSSELDLTKPVNLDGLTTIELVYL